MESVGGPSVSGDCGKEPLQDGPLKLRPGLSPAGLLAGVKTDSVPCQAVAVRLRQRLLNRVRTSPSLLI